MLIPISTPAGGVDRVFLPAILLDLTAAGCDLALSVSGGMLPRGDIASTTFSAEANTGFSGTIEIAADRQVHSWPTGCDFAALASPTEVNTAEGPEQLGLSIDCWIRIKNRYGRVTHYAAICVKNADP